MIGREFYKNLFDRWRKIGVSEEDIRKYERDVEEKIVKDELFSCDIENLIPTPLYQCSIDNEVLKQMSAEINHAASIITSITRVPADRIGRNAQIHILRNSYYGGFGNGEV